MRKLLPPSLLQQVRNSYRGYLPHWQLDNGLYSITFRLADSLPRAAIERLRLWRAADFAARFEARRVFERELDDWLDRGHGSCLLQLAGDIVAGAFRYFDGERYDLTAYCVMPNHAHVVMRLFHGDDLDNVLHSWKSFTAKRINERVQRTGKLWQREYYDRLIRDQEDLDDTIAYVVRNPEKAGLVDWPYVWRAGWKPADRPPGWRRSE